MSSVDIDEQKDLIALMVDHTYTDLVIKKQRTVIGETHPSFNLSALDDLIKKLVILRIVKERETEKLSCKIDKQSETYINTFFETVS